MGFTFCVLEVLLRITEMFIHIKTSENWFFSIVKVFHANFDLTQNLVTEALISCLFPTIDCCNPLAFPRNHWDFPIGMISHEC